MKSTDPHSVGARRLPVPQTAGEAEERLSDMACAIASSENEGIEFTDDVRALLKRFALGEASAEELLAELLESLGSGRVEILEPAPRFTHEDWGREAIQNMNELDRLGPNSDLALALRRRGF